MPAAQGEDGRDDPRTDYGAQLADCVDAHDASFATPGRLSAMLARVGIPDPERCLGRNPQELSGGMRQRLAIAATLLMRPDVPIADEPTTALDVTMEAQIIHLLRDRHSSFLGAIVLRGHRHRRRTPHLPSRRWDIPRAATCCDRYPTGRQTCSLEQMNRAGLASAIGAQCLAWAADGDTLRLRVTADFQALNPKGIIGELDAIIPRCNNATLVRLGDLRDGNQWAPWAAEKIEWVDDTCLAFTLREELVWSGDFGPVTAEAVKYSLNASPGLTAHGPISSKS